MSMLYDTRMWARMLEKNHLSLRPKNDERLQMAHN